jgi:hypothetical protein
VVNPIPSEVPALAATITPAPTSAPEVRAPVSAVRRSALDDFDVFSAPVPRRTRASASAGTSSTGSSTNSPGTPSTAQKADEVSPAQHNAEPSS